MAGWMTLAEADNLYASMSLKRDTWPPSHYADLEPWQQDTIRPFHFFTLPLELREFVYDGIITIAGPLLQNVWANVETQTRFQDLPSKCLTWSINSGHDQHVRFGRGPPWFEVLVANIQLREELVERMIKQWTQRILVRLNWKQQGSAAGLKTSPRRLACLTPQFPHPIAMQYIRYMRLEILLDGPPKADFSALATMSSLRSLSIKMLWTRHGIDFKYCQRCGRAALRCPSWARRRSNKELNKAKWQRFLIDLVAAIPVQARVQIDTSSSGWDLAEAGVVAVAIDMRERLAKALSLRERQLSE